MLNMRHQIICTIGPTSENFKILSNLKKLGVDIYRINLSHTKINQLEKKIKLFKKLNLLNRLCLDTEGAQIRTSNLPKQTLKKNDKIIINKKTKNNKKKLLGFYPDFNFINIKPGTKILIGFDDLKLKVTSSNKEKIIAKVINGGIVESNKGVHFQSNVNLNFLTIKDKQAIEIAKSNNIKKYALSFANTPSDVIEFRNLIGKKSFLISKIETKKGYKNLKKITKLSDSILIDRGDLSRYISIDKIPIAQKRILESSKRLKTPVFVATNFLETMIINQSPTRAESHDIFSTLNDGASGLVLAAETAIGKYPIKCVKFIKESILTFKKYKEKRLKLF